MRRPSGLVNRKSQHESHRQSGWSVAVSDPGSATTPRWNTLSKRLSLAYIVLLCHLIARVVAGWSCRPFGDSTKVSPSIILDARSVAAPGRSRTPARSPIACRRRGATQHRCPLCSHEGTPGAKAPCPPGPPRAGIDGRHRNSFVAQSNRVMGGSANQLVFDLGARLCSD
jgi:hypothetical protein